jgi:hypothetical protein
MMLGLAGISVRFLGCFAGKVPGCYRNFDLTVFCQASLWFRGRPSLIWSCATCPWQLYRWDSCTHFLQSRSWGTQRSHTPLAFLWFCHESALQIWLSRSTEGYHLLSYILEKTSDIAFIHPRLNVAHPQSFGSYLSRLLVCKSNRGSHYL